MYAIVDIETTGSQPYQDKIIEIAVVIHDGKAIIDNFHTLINPGRSIPYYITQLTGITDQMVAHAPRFFEIARKIVEITGGKVFVAHNVRFDYSFIKKEFNDLGFNFQRKTLCTVRLSRKLVPGLPSYSLGKLCNSLGIPQENKHRALGDASATALLFDFLLQRGNSESINNAIDGEIKAALLPQHISREQVSALPDEPGVYYFHDQQGQVIYVGKSNNIRKRVISHFAADYKGTKRIEFKNSIADISYETTGNELIALLYESDLIKKLKPLYNRAQRRSIFAYGLFDYTDNSGYINFKIERLNELQTPLTPITSAENGKELLHKMVEEYKLCQKLCGLYKSNGPCFDYIVHQCNGACVGKEQADNYNERALRAIKRFKYPDESFLIVGKGRHKDEKTVVWVENGCYKGFGYADTTCVPQEIHALMDCVKRYNDNKDVQQIIRGYLRKMKQDKLIVYDASKFA